MCSDTTCVKEIVLHGTWGISEAVQHLHLLTGELELLLAPDPRPASVAIDLAGVESLDACGCQLLALFLGNLKRHGITPEPRRIPVELFEQIRHLGFADAFANEQKRETA